MWACPVVRVCEHPRILVDGHPDGRARRDTSGPWATAQWATFSFFGTQDQAVAGIPLADAATVFDWNGGTLPEYWWCGEQRHTLPGADGGKSFMGLNIPGSLHMALPCPDCPCAVGVL